jgi:ssDNA-binding Zn-finger/Zn-ribbon topoisomerase 1
MIGPGSTAVTCFGGITGRSVAAIHCPHCKSTADHRIIWDTRGLAAVAANTLLYVVQAAVCLLLFEDLWCSDGWSVRRKCRRCGERFLGPQRERPNLDECPRCEYNLTRNVSGRCPECGWKLTRRYRAYRK